MSELKLSMHMISLILKNRYRRSEGFALPTVVIAGLILLIIGASGLQAASSVTRAVADQSWSDLANGARDSGLKYLESCLRNSSDLQDPTRPWVNPITQKTDCKGTSQATYPSYITQANASGTIPAWRTSFTISNPSTNGTLNSKVSTVKGIVEILSASNSVVRTYTSQSTIIMNITGAQLGVQVAKVAGSVLHTCVLLTNKKVYCAGDSTSGQLGMGSGYVSTPRNVGPFPGNIGANDLVSWSFTDGTGQTCIRGEDSFVYCIGYNNVGNFGNGATSINNPLFVPVSGVSSFGGGTPRAIKSSPIVQGTANFVTTCAIGTDDVAYCAGYNGNYQLGDGSTTNRNYPVAFDNIPAPAGQKAIKVIPFVETYTICVLTDLGKGYCHGSNSSGQFGNGTTTNSNLSTPSQLYPSITTEGAIVDIGGADEKSCALYASGALYCAGRLPDASRSTSSSPVRFGATGQLFTDFNMGPTSICAVEAATSNVYCVSKNDGGELGNGGTSTSYSMSNPTKIAGSGAYTPTDASMKLVRVYVGDRKICLHYNVAGSESTTGFLTCAGYNQYGQFGNGTNNSATSYMQQSFGQPYIMPNGVGVKEVYINRGMSLTSRGPTVSENSTANAVAPICILGTDGNAYCAGANNRGQLGDGTTSDRYTPVRFQLPIDP